MRIIGSSLLIFFIMATTLAEPEEMNRLSTSNSVYEVTLVDEKPLECCPYLKRFTFNITYKMTKQIGRFTLGDAEKRLRSIREIYLKGDKLIVKGNLRRGSAISVIDLKRRKLDDFFWCYKPTSSPSNRFLVYIKYFPPHGLPSIRTDVVLIYDMKRKPSENRVPVKGYTKQPKEQVGLPIYPTPYVKAKAYLLSEQQYWPPSWRYDVSSPFLWSEDEKKVVFLCTHHNQTYVVKVDLSLGIEKPKISELPIKIAKKMVKPKYLGGFKLDLMRGSKKDRILFADQIEWDGPDHIIVKPEEYYLKEEIRLPVP